MSLTALVTPNSYQLSKNPVVLKLQTNAYKTAGSVANLVLNAGGTNAVDGTFTFIWAKGEVIFTVKASPDDSGTQVREQGANTLGDYAAMLAVDFKKNYLIGGSLFGSPFILFIAKNTGTDYDIGTNFASVNTGFVAYTSTAGSNDVYAENYKMRADLMVETTHGSDTYTVIGSKALDPISNVCVFDFQAMADNYLSYAIPTYIQTEASITNNTVIRRFKTRYFERYGDPAVEKEVTDTTPGYILKAGIKDRDFVGSTLHMETLFQTPGKFLTKQPRIKLVAEAQKEYLYFIAPKTSSGYTGACRLKITISLKNYKDDIVVLKSSLALTEYRVGLFPVGFTELGLSASAAFEDVKSYTVEVIETSSGNVISEAFTYIPDLDYYADSKYILFSTSSGGFDTLRLTGLLDAGFEIEKETVQVTKLYDTPATTGEYSDVYPIKKDKFKHNTGWITKAQADWIEDLFIAERKFVIAEGKFIPIVIQTVQHGKYNSQTGKTFYEIEYAYANTHPIA
jgi:hypothetical protein